MAEIFNYKIGFESITTSHHNQNIQVNGIIKTANLVKPELVTAVFQCSHCRTLVEVPQGGGKCRLLRPERCVNKGCQSNNKENSIGKPPKFTLLQDKSEFQNYQEVWLKPIENIDKTVLNLGRGQKVILREGLAGLKEGQTVNVTGKVSFELIGRTTFARPVVVATKIKKLK